MAYFNNLSLALVKEKGLLIYVDCRPAEIWQQLRTASDDRYIVRSSGVALRCPHCSCRTQDNTEQCGQCTRPLLIGGKANYSLTVKLASNGVPAHGPFSAALAAWNPCCLKFRIQEYGYGTELKVRFSGSLSVGELVLSIVICSLIGFALYSTFLPCTDYFHCAVAIFVGVFGPLVHVAHRRKQERDLIDFLKKRLPQLLPLRPYSKEFLEPTNLDFYLGQ